MIPIVWLGEGRLRLPILDRDSGVRVAKVILWDEAERPGRDAHSSMALESEFTYYAARPFDSRGSDRVLRIYAAIEILMLGGLAQTEACAEVEDILGGRIGHSPRGRKRTKNPGRKSTIPKSRRAEDVRGIYNDFKKRVERNDWNRDSVVEMRFLHALHIVNGAQKMVSGFEQSRSLKTGEGLADERNQAEMKLQVARKLLALVSDVNGKLLPPFGIPIKIPVMTFFANQP